MTWVRPLARAVLIGVASLILLAAAGLGGGYLWLRGSLPDYSAERRVEGLARPVRIIRDERAVPHIFAETRTDAYFALGYVHAQDRLWQLELTRRVANGRLAEAVGAGGLATDTLVAAFDIEAAARRSEARYGPETRARVAAYVAGINAAIAVRRGPPPVEFLLLGLEPTPWTERDVSRAAALAMLGAGDWRDELLRARLSTRVSCERLHDLFGGFETTEPVTYPDLDARAAPRLPTCGAVAFRAAAASSPAGDSPFGRANPASNSWAVSGRLTATGGPFLANDPHGPLTAPADYYLVRLEAPGFTLVGASTPGSPGFASGRNADIAWGVTDMMADQTDLMVEQVDPDDPGRYRTPDGWAAFETREVTIPVKGAAPHRVTLRHTRNGPVISDIDEDAAGFVREHLGPGHVLSLAGVMAPEGNSLTEAFVRLADAGDWDQFGAALDLFGLQHNFSYADRHGVIGMATAARLPVRGGDGFMPAPGWDRRFAWSGQAAARDLPRWRDPARGFVANANNRLAPARGGLLDSASFQPGWRAGRIVDTLANGGGRDLEGQRALQLDAVSAEFAALRPQLLVIKPESEAGRRALALLADWDGDMRRDRPQPLIWSAWRREAALGVLADDLRPYATAYLKHRQPPLSALLAPESPWCDDRGAPAVETCADIVAAAFERAVAGLTAERGRRPERWRWGDAHRAVFRHAILSGAPVIGALVTPTVQADGDALSINSGQSDLWGETPYLNVYGPRYRQIVDLADPARSLYMIAPGVSGNPLSPWYGRLARDWSAGRYFTLGQSADDLRRTSAGETRLSPARR